MQILIRDDTRHGEQYVLLAEAEAEIEAAVAAERERWKSVVEHAASELEDLDDETAQVQATALRGLLGPNVADKRHGTVLRDGSA